MTDANQVFLSYSRNDPEAAASLRAQLERRGVSVFKDDQSIREGDQWLTRLQEAVDGCGGFVVLVGRDGVARWIGAETQVALIRYFGPHDDAERLPIFPVLLGDTAPGSLARFSREVLKEPAEMASIRPLLESNDRGLADWLRGRKRTDTAFLLAIDQLEELFTFADPTQRQRFDRLLATALADADCALFLISTVRADFLDRFAEDLPRLAEMSNQHGKSWRLPPIGADGLREIISGPTDWLG